MKLSYGLNVYRCRDRKVGHTTSVCNIKICEHRLSSPNINKNTQTENLGHLSKNF